MGILVREELTLFVCLIRKRKCEIICFVKSARTAIFFMKTKEVVSR